MLRSWGWKKHSSYWTIKLKLHDNVFLQILSKKGLSKVMYAKGWALQFECFFSTGLSNLVLHPRMLWSWGWEKHSSNQTLKLQLHDKVFLIILSRKGFSKAILAKGWGFYREGILSIWLHNLVLHPRTLRLGKNSTYWTLKWQLYNKDIVKHIWPFSAHATKLLEFF